MCARLTNGSSVEVKGHTSRNPKSKSSELGSIELQATSILVLGACDEVTMHGFEGIKFLEFNFVLRTGSVSHSKKGS